MQGTCLAKFLLHTKIKNKAIKANEENIKKFPAKAWWAITKDFKTGNWNKNTAPKVIINWIDNIP